MSSNNSTLILFNITFKTKEIDNYHLYIQTNNKQYFNTFVDNLKYTKLSYNKNIDINQENSDYTSRTFYTFFDDFNSHNDNMKIIIKTDFEKSYETKLLKVKKNNINYHYNIKFNCLDKNEVYRYPPQIKRFSDLYEYNQIISSCLCSDDDYLKTRVPEFITKESYFHLINNTNISDNTEDKIFLCYYMRKYLNPDEADYFFNRMDDLKLILTDIPLNLKNLEMVNFIEELINDLIGNEIPKENENKLFFVLYFLIYNEKYEVIKKINLENRRYVFETFKQLIKHKISLKIDFRKFEKLIKNVNPNLNKNVFHLFYSLIEKDQDLINCLDKSWKVFPEKILHSLSNARGKINALEILNYLSNKNLETAKLTFIFLEENLSKYKKNIQDKISIYNNSDINDPDYQAASISFFKIFELNYLDVLTIFIKEANDSEFLSFLLNKANNYSESDLSLKEHIKKDIYLRVDRLISQKLNNSKNCPEILENLMEFQKYFPLNIKKNFYDFGKYPQRENSIDEFFIKMTIISNDEQLGLYKKINFEEYLNYQNLNKLKEYEVENLNFRCFFNIYDKERIKKMLFNMNHYQIKIRFLFKKILKAELIDLHQNSEILIEFLNNFSSLFIEEEFKNINFEDIFYDFLEDQLKSMNLEIMISFYLENLIIENIENNLIQNFILYFVRKIEELSIDKYYELLNITFYLAPKSKQNTINFIIKILEISKKFLPNDMSIFFKNEIDIKILLFNLIFNFIKELDSSANIENSLNFEDNKILQRNNNSLFIESNNDQIQNSQIEQNIFIDQLNKFFPQDIKIFKKFCESLVVLNNNFFNDLLKVKDYSNFNSFKDQEKIIKASLMGIIKADYKTYFQNLEKKLDEASKDIYLLNNVYKFTEFYFKNLGDKNDQLDHFSIKYSEVKDKEYNELKKILDESKELVDLYYEYCQVDNEQFKKIFEFIQKQNKNKINYSDKIEYLKKARIKVDEMKNCLLSEQKNFLMREIVDNFLPLLDKKIDENLKDFKEFYKIENDDNDVAILNALNIYSNSLQAIKSSSSMKKFIELYKIEKSDFFVDLEKTFSNLTQIEGLYVGDYIDSFRNNNLDKFLKDEELLRLIDILNESKESYDFLTDKEEDEVRTLIEFVDELGDTFIKPDTIKSCIKMMVFLKNLKENINKKLCDKEILNFLYDILYDKKIKKRLKNIAAYLDDVGKKINEIKQLYNKIANREEYSKIKIKEMFINSQFTISQQKNLNNFGIVSYSCIGTYGNNKKTNLEEMRELKDRSLLLSKKKNIEDIKNNTTYSINSSLCGFSDLHSKILKNESIKIDNINIEFDETKFENEENDYILICKNFSEIVNNIMIIYENLNYLYENGYHENYTILFNIKMGQLNININNKNFTLEDALNYFADCFYEIENSYKKLYTKYPLMTFFHGRQIITLYESFLLLNPLEIRENKSPDEKEKINEGLYLLNYLFEKEIDKFLIQEKWISPDFKNEKTYLFMDVLIYVANFIDLLEIEFKFLNSEKEGDIKYSPGLYSIYLDKGEFEKEIIKINQNFSSKNYPNYKNILNCDHKISLIMIKSFLYRAFYYESNEPFILVNSDSLSNDIQLEIHRFIKNMLQEFSIEQNKQIKSRLIITYSSPVLEFVNKIKKLPGIKNLDPANLEKNINIEFLENNTICVVKSDASGIGKSFHIRSFAKKQRLDYNYFPISGVIEKFHLIHRLKNLKLYNNSLLHVDLNECDNEYIIREFLFELSVTKCFLHNEYVYNLNHEIKIYIEIPFGFIDYTSKYPLLKNCRTIFIEKNKKAEIDINENFINIQIVANYLLNLKNGKIVNNNIYLGCLCENNNHSDICQYKRSVPLVELKKDLIHELLNEYFDFQEHSYYQINTFIDFLAFQFKIFSTNFYFGVSILMNNQFAKLQQLLPSRKILVESYIDITKYFTKSAYDNLLNIQENTHRFMLNQGRINDNEIFQNFINEEIISFDEIEFVMIFFNNDGQGISIIVKEDNPNYDKLYDLYNAFSLEERNHNLIDYEKLTNDEFLEQLQIVLGKQNLVLRDHTGILSLYDTKGYVFTSDNFLKMQLILLRINSNIPVIMMGETGCGKTSLIKILAELLNVKLCILNIHAGIEDKNIVDFIDKIINEMNYFEDDDFIEYDIQCEKLSQINIQKLIKNQNDNVTEIEDENENESDNDLELEDENEEEFENDLYLKDENEDLNDYNNEINLKKIIKINVENLFKAQSEKNKIWIFLDEINTCNSLGLLSEILCNRTYLGKKIPKNICFICACNPYRLYSNIISSEIGLNYFNENSLEKMENISQSLVYKVNPLPFSLLNYVFDFGSLVKRDELNYIESMIRKSFLEENIKINNELYIITYIKNVIFSSQEFIRDKNSEISSVSLRDVRRFIIFFRWFRKSISKRAEFTPNIYENINKNNEELIIISTLLSIFLIYYLRIPKKEIKNDFIEMLCNIMTEFDKRYQDPIIIKNILLNEEKDILSRVDPPLGIAWNCALLENVFATFHCINNKVPVYICGKPGCSKSLAIQLIYSSMRGENSRDSYFKTLPRLFMNCYQGSTTSKSSGIINVFKKARNLINGNSETSDNKSQVLQEKVISLVFFDEMGLAENSKNNPLKVLHSELEPDNEHDKVAFVGISNWKLDASKTNRGIFVCRPDLDEEDLIITVNTIAESYKKYYLKKETLQIAKIDENEFFINSCNDNLLNKELLLSNSNQIEENSLNDISKFSKIFESLARTYFNYKNDIKFNKNNLDGFHGTRDFYFMIKNIAKSIINANHILEDNEKELNEIIEDSIRRNFSGFKDSLKKFKNHLKNYYKPAKNLEIDQTKAIQTIKSNLDDIDCRYLMIIGESQLSINFMELLISNLKLNNNHKIVQNKSVFSHINLENIDNRFAFILGSQFINDIESNEKNFNEYNEEYSFKILNKIQVYMEQGKILILSGLSSIYSSLYDLFNQNFSIVGGKKYARIALGTSNNPMVYVHDDFKCIIILNEEEVEKQDPPFLNRFEKTIINFESLLDKNYYQEGGRIYEKLRSYFDLNLKNKYEIQLDVFKNLINFNQNEIFGLVYNSAELIKEDDPKIFEEKILAKIVPTFSQDIISLINKNLNSQANELYKINSIYVKNLHNNLEEYVLKKLINIEKNSENTKRVNFVYTYTSIFDEILLKDDLIKAEVHAFTSFKCENDLEKAFSIFMKKEKNTFILKFTIEDLNMLNYSKFLCEKTLTNFKLDSLKLFTFIIYTKRIFIEDYNLDNLKKKDLSNLCDNKNCISFLYEADQIFIDNLNPNPEFEITEEEYFNIDKEILPYNKQRSTIYLDNQDIKKNKFKEYDFNINYIQKQKSLIFKENENLEKNLFGYEDNKKYLNILHIKNQTLEEILNNNKIFNQEKLICSSLYNSYMKIYFDSENYEENQKEDYIEQIIDLIVNNKNLRDKIISKSIESLPLKDKWFDLIMNKRKLFEEKIDLLSIVQVYLADQFQYCLDNVIICIEKNDLLECLLFYKNEKLVFDYLCNKTIKEIEKLNLKSIEVKDKIRGNVIKRIFGFKLPNSNNFFKMLMPSLEKNIISLNQIEEEMRNFYFEDDIFSENLYSELIEIKDNLNENFQSLIKTNHQFDYLLDIKDGKVDSDLLKSLLDDFLLYYTLNNIAADKENIFRVQKELNNLNIFDKDIISLLKFIIKAEFNKTDFSIQNFFKCFSFIMGNTIFIQNFLGISLNLKKFFPDYLEELNKIIYYIKFPFDKERKNIEAVNQGQYRLSCSIINFIFLMIGNLDILNDQQTYDFLNEIKSIKDKLIEIDFSLKLNNKSIKIIAIIDELNNFLIQEEKNYLSEFYKKYVEISGEDIKFSRDPNIKSLIDNFSKTYNFIHEKLKILTEKNALNNKEIEKKLYKFLIEYLILKFQSYENKEYREYIVNLIISDKNLFANSKNFIQNYFYYNYDDEYDLQPFYNQESNAGEINNFGKFASLKNGFLEKIQNSISKVNLDPEEIYIMNSIILIFEVYIQKYFKTIESPENMEKFENDILEGSSFDYFKKALEIWDHLSNYDQGQNLNRIGFDEDDILYPFILKLYAISYIRIYLDIYVKLNIFKHQDLDFTNINKILNTKTKKSLVLKMYILKILKEKYLKSWKGLNEFEYNKHQMNWKYNTEELIIHENEKNQANTFFINLLKQDEYKDIESILITTIGQQYKNDITNLIEKIKDENFQLLLDAILNNIFVNIMYEKNSSLENSGYKAFCEFASTNFIKLNISRKNLIAKAFGNVENFFPDLFKIINQPVEIFEIYFVLFKCFLLLLNSPENTLYDFISSIENNNFNLEFKNRFLLGKYNEEINKLFISYKEIKKVNDLVDENNPYCIGCYLCECKTHYFVERCGSPVQSWICYSCNSPIGANNNQFHTLAPNNIRIFKNEKHRNTVIKNFGAQDGAYPYMYTDDLKNIINEKIEKSNPDFSQITKEMLLQRDLTLPDIEPITFRILNLMENLFLYLSYKLMGFLNEENYNNYKINGFGCLENIENNLILLSQLLEKYNIKNTALFLNYVFEIIIFQHFYKLKKEINFKEKIEKEIEINEIIKKIISDSNDQSYFDKYKINHFKIQEQFVQYNPLSLTILLDDERNYNLLNDEERKFPDFKYFKLYKDLDRKFFLTKLEETPNYEIEYPVIYNFITKENSLEKLNNINKLNPFVNEMINQLSYNISRNEAKLPENTIISRIEKITEFENDRNELIKKFENFRDGWKDIFENAVQFGCKNRMQPLTDITKNHPIANVLNDDGEYYFGMYIAAGYQYLCDIQNEFLFGIENAIQKNVKLFYLKNNFKNKIIVQKAKPFQVIKTNKQSFGKYQNFDNLIIQNCFLNYLNHQSIEFNFESIEKILSSILIQGKKFFSDDQIFIVYAYEYFRKNNSAIITNLSNRIPQIKINNDEKCEINNFIDPTIKFSKNGEKTQAILTKMIFFLQSTDMEPDTPLFKAAERMKKYIVFDRNINDFLNKNFKFTIEKLVDIYNYVENICYEEIKRNVSNDYKRILSDKKREKINLFYLEHPQTIITKNRLATAVRRFVSRFLTKEDDLDKGKELLEFLFAKEEFWEKEIFNNEKFDQEGVFLSNSIRSNGKFKFYQTNLIEINNEENEIKISEAVDLYEFLGGDRENIVNVKKHINIPNDGEDKEKIMPNSSVKNELNEEAKQKKKEIMIKNAKKNFKYKN